MSWIETYTGRKIRPLNPRVEDIHLEDIAHALSQICRFTGHTKHFWSVAQHSLLVHNLIVEQYPNASVDIRLQALLHDASEAYLCDIASPIKQHMPQYKEDEKRMEAVIADRFNLSHPWDRRVKQADVVSLCIEARELMPSKGADWEVFDVETIAQGRSIPRGLLLSNMVTVEDLFSQRVRNLIGFSREAVVV